MKKLAVATLLLLTTGLANVHAEHHLPAVSEVAESAPTQVIGQLTVEHARAKSNIPGVKVSAGYFTLTNNSDQVMRFTAVSTPAAKFSEFHNMIMDGNKMVMRKLDDIRIEPQQRFVFKPKSYHLMFMGLNQRFIPGEKILVTLYQDNGNSYPIELTIMAMQSH